MLGNDLGRDISHAEPIADSGAAVIRQKRRLVICRPKR